MSWSGVKRQSIKAEMEAWCEEMGIKNYTINSQSEIDVKGGVDLQYSDFKELPYKFGTVTGYFDLEMCENLKSLKGSPRFVGGSFYCLGCKNLDSLEGCPKEVNGYFNCRDCKQKFTKEEVLSLCKAKNNVYIQI